MISVTQIQTVSCDSSLCSSYINTIRVSVASPNECTGNVYVLPNRIKSPFTGGQKMRPFTGDQGLQQELSYYPPESLHLRPHLTFGRKALPHSPSACRQRQGAQQGTGAWGCRGSQKCHGPSVHRAVMIPKPGGYRVPPLPYSQTRQKGLELPGEAD